VSELKLHDFLIDNKNELTRFASSRFSGDADPVSVLTEQVAVSNQLETEVAFVDRSVIVLAAMITNYSVFDAARSELTRRCRRHNRVSFICQKAQKQYGNRLQRTGQ